jgi:hypothetical protein
MYPQVETLPLDHAARAIDHNIGFDKNGDVFRQKMAKLNENGDHIISPGKLHTYINQNICFCIF